MLSVPLVLATCLLAQEPDETVTCRLHGRFVTQTGEPVAGVELRLSARVGSARRAERRDVPADWRDPAPIASDADGRFELSIEPPPALHFYLDAECEGYGRVAWSWAELAPGELDLGTTVLERPGVIVGRAVDQKGRPCAEGFRLTGSVERDAMPTGQIPPVTLATVDPESGRFRVYDLPPGRAVLTLEEVSGTRQTSRRVVTSQEMETRVALVLPGPGIPRRIELHAAACPPPIHLVEGSVRATDIEGLSWPLEPVSRGHIVWRLLDVGAGPYTLEIADPRFLPWRLDGVTGNATVRAELAGSATLSLSVRLAGEERELDRYGLRALHRGPEYTWRACTLSADGSAAPEGGLWAGVQPGDLQLEVRAAGRPPHWVRVDALAPGETRQVELAIGPPLSLRGRVLHPDGRPAGGVRVQLTWGELPGADRPLQGVTSDGVRYRDAEVVTDAEGRFALGDLAPGPYSLRAVVGPWMRVDRRVELPAKADEPTVELPQHGAIEVDVLRDPGADLSGYAIRALLWDEFIDILGFWEAPDVPLPEEGPLVLNPARAGSVVLQLLEDHGAGPGYRDIDTVVVCAGETTHYVLDLRRHK